MGTALQSMLNDSGSFATLLTGAIGFVGVMMTLATNAWFARRQERETARLAREAQSHAADLSRQESREDAERQLKQYERHRQEEAKAVAGAIYGELNTLAVITELRGYYSGIEAYAIRSLQTDIPVWYGFEAKYDPFPVYNANLPQLGLLPPELASRVCMIYTLLRSVLEDATTMKLDAEGPLNAAATRHRLLQMYALATAALRVEPNLLADLAAFCGVENHGRPADMPTIDELRAAIGELQAKANAGRPQ